MNTLETNSIVQHKSSYAKNRSNQEMLTTFNINLDK